MLLFSPNWACFISRFQSRSISKQKKLFFFQSLTHLISMSIITINIRTDNSINKRNNSFNPTVTYKTERVDDSAVVSLAITIDGLPLGFLPNKKLLQQILFEYPAPSKPSIIWSSSPSASHSNPALELNTNLENFIDNSDQFWDADDESDEEKAHHLSGVYNNSEQGSTHPARLDSKNDGNCSDGSASSSSSLEITCLGQSSSNPPPSVSTTYVNPRTKIYREDDDGGIIITSDDSDTAALIARARHHISQLRESGVIPTVRKRMRYLRKSNKWIPNYHS